jgi:hypothetical protein
MIGWPPQPTSSTRPGAFMPASAETTQEIDYLTCDTLQIRRPVVAERHRPPLRRRLAKRAVRFWRRVVLRWDDVWPPMVGCLLGVSGAVAFWLLFLIIWLDLH